MHRDDFRAALCRLASRDAELAKRGPHLDERSVATYLRGESSEEETVQEHLTHCRSCQELVLSLAPVERRRRLVTPRGWQAWAPGDRRGPRQFDSWLPAAWYWLRSWLRSLPFLDRRR